MFARKIQRVFMHLMQGIVSNFIFQKNLQPSFCVVDHTTQNPGYLDENYVYVPCNCLAQNMVKEYL